MEAVGSTKDVNVVALFDGSAMNDSKIYHLQKDTDISKVTSPVVRDMGEADMGSVQTVTEFAQFTKDNYPAEKYVFIMWNHGSGWKLAEEEAAPIFRGISYDDQSGNHLTTVQLGQALAKTKDILGQTIDIYVSDACLMNMIEIAYEIRKTAGIMVGSENLEPGDGLNYTSFLSEIVAKPTMDAVEFSKVFVRTYVEHYQKIGTAVCYSAIDLTKLEPIADAYKMWGGELALAEATTAKTYFSKLPSYRGFYYSDYKDIMNVLGGLQAQIPALGGALQFIINATKDAVIANQTYGTSLAHSTGLAQWFPSQSQFGASETKYRELQWAQASGFADSYRRLVTLAAQ
jgi:hypothetical protein